jgi:hypothetical protein
VVVECDAGDVPEVAEWLGGTLRAALTDVLGYEELAGVDAVATSIIEAWGGRMNRLVWGRVSSAPYEPHEGSLNGRTGTGGPPLAPMRYRGAQNGSYRVDLTEAVKGADVRVGDLPARHYTNGGRA